MTTQQTERDALIEAVEESAYDWTRYVEADSAPHTLSIHLAPSIAAVKAAMDAQAQRIAELGAENAKLHEANVAVSLTLGDMESSRNTLRDELDALRGQEPVAYLCERESGNFDVLTDQTCKKCFPVFAAPVAPAQLAELQSGDELPEPVMVMECDGVSVQYAPWDHPDKLPHGKHKLYTAEQLRQAQAMARAKMLAELGEVGAVLVVGKEPDDSDINQVHAGNAQVSYPTINFAQPAQDVNAELVEALEAVLRMVTSATPNIDVMITARTALSNVKAAQQKGQK